MEISLQEQQLNQSLCENKQAKGCFDICIDSVTTPLNRAPLNAPGEGEQIGSRHHSNCKATHP